MTDEPQNPENEQTPDDEAAALAEHHAVPTADAAEIAGSAEDAALEAFEEAQSAAAQTETEPPVAESAQDAPAAAAAPVVPEAAAPEPAAAETVAQTPAAGAPGVAETVAPASSEPVAVAPATPSPAPDALAGTGEADAEDEDFEDDDDEEPAPRVKPAVPGAHLEVDIVPEGVDPLGRDVVDDPYAIEDEAPQGESEEEDKALPEPISTAAIDLAAGARYRATGKRKTAIARVILRPGSGSYTINGRSLDAYFPRATLQRNIRQPLETVGYEERMDVVARLHGGGVSAQAGALRHGISRALLEADPNLRGELKRRGFLTRDSRAKERKKAGLKKARKRPQFSKR
jgi:small subunit ribosomal protein S9